MRRISLESFHRATYPPCIFAVPSFPAPGKGLGITPRPKLGFHEAALDQLRPNLPEEIRMKAIRLTLLFALALGVAQLVPRDASARTYPFESHEIQSSLGDPDGNPGGISVGNNVVFSGPDGSTGGVGPLGEPDDGGHGLAGAARFAPSLEAWLISVMESIYRR